MTTHTHRGHCQACGRLIAIDTATGTLAKHGYDVQHGYFRGECGGTNELSLHISRVITDGRINMARQTAAAAAADVVLLSTGAIHPALIRTGYRWENHKQVEVIVAWADASPLEQRDAVKRATAQCEADVRFWTSHADMLTKWADRICGKVPAYRVVDLNNPALVVGDVVRIGGKKGFDATVEAVADREMTTHGYRRGRQTIVVPHVQVTRPAKTVKEYNFTTGKNEPKIIPAKTYWEPVRGIKREASRLVQELKADGLLS